MPNKKATYIRVEWDDGTFSESASPEDAEKQWNAIMSAFTMDWVHGARYSGPIMREGKKEQDVQEKG